MPITFSNITPVRRVAVGDCFGPLGSGFDALARSAYSALLRAEWSQSADPPFLPVHDNGQTANKTIPRGDAWKCSYGYDAAARTERSACGAVAYTFELPADAYSGTPANISTVALSLTGDRYLESGVDLYVYSSGDSEPYPVSAQPGSALVGTYCATSSQSPTPPNQRHGVTEAVSAAIGSRAWRFLHVVLLLHDYTANRGAWIEGGAMLDGASASVEFSREVSPDSEDGVKVIRVTDAARIDEQNLYRVAIALFSYVYFVRGKLDASRVADVAFDAATEIRSLALDGRIHATMEARMLDYSFDAREFGPRLYADKNRIRPYDVMTFYYAPSRSIAGRTIAVPVQRNTTDTGNGTIRVALVEADTVPQSDDWSAYDSSRMVADAWSGGGPSLLGYADIEISGHAPSEPTTITVQIPIQRDATKPYIAVVMQARTINESGACVSFGWTASQEFPDGIIEAI